MEMAKFPDGHVFIYKPNRLGIEIEERELIMCRNCKHRDPEDHKCDCGHDIQWQLPRADNWFCADGEPNDALS